MTDDSATRVMQPGVDVNDSMLSDLPPERSLRAALAFRVGPVRFLPALVVVAIALRAVGAVVLHSLLLRNGGDGFFNPDERGYDQVAWAQAELWHGIGPGVNPVEAYLLNVFTYTQAAIFFVIGHHPLAIKLLNSVLGGLTVGLVFMIAWRIFGSRPAVASGVAALLFPSTFLWAISGLKDTMFGLAIMLVLWLLIELIATTRKIWLIPFFVALALLGGLRDYVQAMIGIIAPFSIAVQSSRWPRKWLVVTLLVVGCVALVVTSAAAKWLLTDPARLNQQRSCAAMNADSSFLGEDNDQLLAECAGVGTTEGMALAGRSVKELVAWLPHGAMYAAAAPFPWTATRLSERATIPEMLCWYVAVTFAVVALIVSWRAQWRAYLPIVLYVGGISLLLALTQGNLGTLVRHRSMIIPSVLVFSGFGVVYALQALVRRNPQRFGRLDALLDA
ncbi:MAG: glycosyltransferase family 39 protein [Thermomicrobiales bacterium]